MSDTPEHDVSELIDMYMDQNNLYRIEGRKGVETLCQLSRVLGYKDPQYFGQLSSRAALGDLVMFLEDNSGAVEAVIEWMKSRNFSEFREPLLEAVVMDAVDPDEDEDAE